MPKLWRVPAAARQWRRDVKSVNGFKRTHEPTELMGGKEANSYNDATQTSLVPVHRILTRMAYPLLPDATMRPRCGSNPLVVDFGTGPAASHIVMARAMPSIHVLGLEASDDMVRIARRNIEIADVQGRMVVEEADCTTEQAVQKAGESKASLATSVYLAHQFRDENGRTGLDKAVTMLRLMARVTLPLGSILVLDFIRPPSEKVVEMVVEATGPGTVITDADYRNSLRAAFSLAEWRQIVVMSGVPDLQIAVCEGPLPLMLAVYKIGFAAREERMDTDVLPPRPPLGLMDQLAAVVSENIVLAKGFRDGGFSYI